MLVLSRDCDTVVHIGPNVQVKILSIRKRRVKLGIEAPSSVRVWRDEIVSGLSERGLNEEEVLGPAVGAAQFVTLVVEDDPAHAELISRTLADGGRSDLKLACSGAEAVEEFDREEDRGDADSAPVRLVLLDLHLPDMSGLDVLRHVRSNDLLATTPVVVFSAEEREDIVRDCLQAGANAFVTKSVDFDKFRKSIARITAFWSSEPYVPAPAATDSTAGRRAK